MNALDCCCLFCSVQMYRGKLQHSETSTNRLIATASLVKAMATSTSAHPMPQNISHNKAVTLPQSLVWFKRLIDVMSAY